MTLFYYEGKCFDNAEDFQKYVMEWPSLPFDEEGFKKFLDMRLMEAKMNYDELGDIFTNLKAHQLLRMSTEWAEERER